MDMSQQQRTAALFTTGTTRDWHTLEPWICQMCREIYPVMSLARDCEDKHEAEGWDVPEIYQERESA